MLKAIKNIFITFVLVFPLYECHTFNIIVKSSSELEKLTKQISKTEHNQPSNPIKRNKPNDLPTIREASLFNATADAITIRKATHGFGTDEDTIIEVLTRRSNRQRQFIAQAFRKQYEKGLLKTLIDETSGHFQDILVALMTPRIDYLAKRLYMDGDSDIQLLIDIICTIKSNEEMRDLTVSKKSLESLLASSTKGILRKLLINLSHADRDENTVAKREVAEKDSQDLFKAGEQKSDTDESVFIKVLTRRSFPQINQMLQSYEDFTNHRFENAIKTEFDGVAERAFLTLIQSARNKTASYFAERLHESIFPKPIPDDITFIVVTRSEKDLGNIKAEYNKKYKRTLANDIKGKITGDSDYTYTLLALIGR